MALSKKAREILVVAMANEKAAKEVADAIDAADNSSVQEQIDDLEIRVKALEDAAT